MKALFTLLAAYSLISLHAAGEPLNRPNILWLIAEDMSPHFGCYGEKTIQTPNVDKLAAGGVLFEHAFVTGPICSPSRSALITGMYQTSIGAHHHRSGVGMKIQLPTGVELVPKLAAYQGRKPKSAVIRNIALMKQWAKENK
jgi:arylsulfatase A-like enzyme